MVGDQISSRPRYTVDEVSMKEVDPQWLADQIMIIDFGIAFLQDQPSPDIGTPKNYCAPEFLFKTGRSVRSDVWALGCTIFEIRTGAGLFQYQATSTRDQRLVAMVDLLGPLPEKWWDKWKEGRKWYDTETRLGGQLAEATSGTLFREIMEIGVHDGESSPRKDRAPKLDVVVEESGKRQTSTVEDEMNATSRLIALVAEITTSEAAEVIARVNELSMSSPDQKKPGSSDSDKNESGGSSSLNAKGNSGSSNAKSGEKSISSEGISTGAGTGALTSTGTTTIDIGVEGNNVVALAKDLVEAGKVEEFLELVGTKITNNEAEALEDLLRKALMHLPEQRLRASELAKHHWFFDKYEVGVIEPLIA